MTTKFGQKNLWPECNTLWGQRSHKGQPESLSLVSVFLFRLYVTINYQIHKI